MIELLMLSFESISIGFSLSKRLIIFNKRFFSIFDWRVSRDILRSLWEWASRRDFEGTEWFSLGEDLSSSCGVGLLSDLNIAHIKNLSLIIIHFYWLYYNKIINSIKRC